MREAGRLAAMSSESNQPAFAYRDPRQKVAAHLRELASEALDNSEVDLGLAARIADALLQLIEATADSEPAAIEAVRGAVDYFVLTRDESSDFDHDGLKDDARVVNKVAADLSEPEIYIRL